MSGSWNPAAGGAIRGRFAPTPSGPLHLGSLVTALASYLSAKSAGGRWLLRIDDLDRPRVVPGAEADIRRALEAHGLHWDEEPRRQSEHVQDYLAALMQLESQGLLYRCDCTRLRLATQSPVRRFGPVYDGHCREHPPPSAAAVALRLRLPERPLGFTDGILGATQTALGEEIGDFVVRRRDGIIAYQLACVVDEQAMSVTEVVRGHDLLSSTFQQLTLMELRGQTAPQYAHVPVLVDAAGRKLSKQNHARRIEAADAASNLLRCLRLLGQETPSCFSGRTPVPEVLDWAMAHWRIEAVPPRETVADHR